MKSPWQGRTSDWKGDWRVDASVNSVYLCALCTFFSLTHTVIFAVPGSTSSTRHLNIFILMLKQSRAVALKTCCSRAHQRETNDQSHQDPFMLCWQYKAFNNKEMQPCSPPWACAWPGADGRFVWYEASCRILAVFLGPLLSCNAYWRPLWEWCKEAWHEWG